MDVLQLGATLTQQTSLTESLPTELLNSTVNYVNLSLGVNGTTDPEPEPGVFDWTSLDARMDQVAPLGSSVVMRVFDAPPWMSARAKSKAAVLPRYYQAFADLVVDVARRYPQIHYFMVWNELMGYRGNPSQWNFRGYTNLYNVVYRALKAYNPDLQVGGPYAPFPPATDKSMKSNMTGPWGTLDQNSLDTVTYWLQHKAGADFLVVDGRTAAPDAIPSQPAAATELFSAVDRWLEQQTSLPIWWAEWYARSPELGSKEWNAVSAYALLQLADSGASAAFIWDAEFIPGGQSTATPGLWISGTNEGTALAPVFESLKSSFYRTMVKLYAPVAGVEVLTNNADCIAVDVDGVVHRHVPICGRKVRIRPYQISIR